MGAGMYCATVLVGAMWVVGGVAVAAENNSSLAPLTTVAVSAPAATTAPVSKYDAVFSVCGYSHSADQSSYNIETDNGISPMTPIYPQMFSSGMTVEQIKATSVNMKVLKGPTHGELVPSGAASFTYHANQGYLGVDQMVFEVEVLGKKFKVIQTEVIQNSGNLDYPTDAAKELFDSSVRATIIALSISSNCPPMVSFSTKNLPSFIVWSAFK